MRSGFWRELQAELATMFHGITKASAMDYYIAIWFAIMITIAVAETVRR